ncbi:hypothetical protein JHK82_048765 [Glycine max]|nr:hypothetical protein GLYMA_17G244366v4 [Glycine max]KAG5098911.1 hypothetical protein JHK82_048765 [Glycine max]
MNIPTRGRPTRRQPPHLRHSPTHRRRVRQRFLCIHEENWIGKIRRAFEGSEMVLGRRKCDSDSRFSRAYICQIFGGTCGDKRTLVSLPFLQYLFFSYSCWSGHWKEGFACPSIIVAFRFLKSSWKARSWSFTNGKEMYLNC